MATVLLAREEKPELILSSPAVRAIVTARHFAEKLATPKERFKTDMRIYHASVHQLLEVISELDDQLDTVAMVGHNPGFSSLAEYFTGDQVYMVTCAIARIRFEVDSWQELGRETGRLVYLDYPKRHNVKY